jgi:AbiV family abortive infection protein
MIGKWKGSQFRTSHPTMLWMATIEEIEPILNACLLNAERLLNSAKAVMAPGQYHVAYHLAALAMEEIGKAGLIFVESMDLKNEPEEEESRLSRWMEDHERKLFWAIWLPAFGIEADWRTIPKHLEFAKGIHETRLQTLYFDPAYPSAQDEITEERAGRLIGLTESRLEMELPKAKKWGAKVDWDGRDEQYARRVKSVKASLIASQIDVMFRISRERIAAALGIDASKMRKGRYARTSRAIQAVVETSEQYKVRKLFWVIENPKAGLPSTFSALLYKVEIRPHMRSIPVIAEAMKAAEELFQQRKISGVIAAMEPAA